MTENLIEAQYDITKKSRIKTFYETNKILIYSSIAILVIILLSTLYYYNAKEKKRILISENYIQAKVYLQNENNDAATKILKKIVYADDPTYSTLSFFMIMNQNLISDHNEVLKIFDYLLENNKFDKEIKSLILYKKALYSSSYVDEIKLLENTKKLLQDDESTWKPHTLLLLGDFYFSRKENMKAKDFYSQVLSMKDLQNDLYEQAKSQLIFITND